MADTFLLNNKKLSYTEKGEGFPIVLLHGYLETKEVWDEYADLLSDYFRVVTLDIPGHGKSDVIADVHEMDLLAQNVDLLLTHLKIEKCVMVGHSMGGYLALAYASEFSSRINGLVLFHSSVYADNDEKKNNRKREIEFIRKGKKDLIFNVNLPKMFADDNVDEFQPVIKSIQEKAKLHSEDGICALLEGMMARVDQQELIKDGDFSKLFIFGRKDNYIPVEAAEAMASLSDTVQVEWLNNSGHMGFVEELEHSVQIMKWFAGKCAMG